MRSASFHKESYVFFKEGYQEIIMSPHEIASYSKPEKETSEMGCADTCSQTHSSGDMNNQFRLRHPSFYWLLYNHSKILSSSIPQITENYC